MWCDDWGGIEQDGGDWGDKMNSNTEQMEPMADMAESTMDSFERLRTQWTRRGL